MSQQNQTTRPLEDEIDMREELDKYIKRWPWFLVGVVLCLGMAFIYLKVTSPTYHTITSIIIKDEERKGPSSEMAAFADMGFFSGMGANSIENEIGILSSKRIMTNVAKELNLNITYFNEDAVQSPELYLNSPYLAKILMLDQRKLARFTKKDENQFIVREISEEKFSNQVAEN